MIRKTFSLLIALAIGATVGVAVAETPAPVTRTVTLDHIGTEVAVIVLRSIFDANQTVKLPDTQTVVFSLSPVEADAAVALLEKLDVPAISWNLELVASTGSGEQVVRSLRIEEEELSFKFQNGSSVVQLRFRITTPAIASLTTSYALRASGLDLDENSFSIEESGTETVTSGENMTLLEPNGSEARRSLAEALGLAGEASALFLRLSRAGA